MSKNHQEPFISIYFALRAMGGNVYNIGGFQIPDPGSATPVQVGVLRAILSILDFLDHPAVYEEQSVITWNRPMRALVIYDPSDEILVLYSLQLCISMTKPDLYICVS